MTATTSTSLPTSTIKQRRLGYWLLAALAYVPVLFTAVGKVAADTKQYLYLDPTRLLTRAVSMWDSNIGLGTVTHQNIGYVFPMGPYYWICDRLGLPDWIAQRIWLGSILFLAALGVLYLMRTLHVSGVGVPVAAVAFMLSPYSLDYAARISIILLPFAGLPWMLALTIRALRKGGWRYPALFAIVVQIVGGVNATALIFAGVAPVLWIVYATFISREVSFRSALGTTFRIGALTIFTSLWWMAGLSLQAGYGLDVLKYTETVKTVSTASVAPEIFRGLGYWFFYGRDKLGPWIESGVSYTQWVWLILVGYAIPTLALGSAVVIRWKHRLYFALLAFVGLAIAVGAHPYDSPSWFGGLMKAFADVSSAGLALRSTGRAVPLVALSMAVFLGLGVNVVAEWLSTHRGVPWRRVMLVPGVVLALIIVNFPALWNGSFYGKNLQRPEQIPQYWKQAAKAIDAGDHQTRVLEIPGSDFASYRWGNLVDPLTPGITDRPYVARELIPWGSAASSDLLNALDRRLQEGVLDPSSIAPVAQLMGVGAVVARNDLQVDRYNLIRPVPMKSLLTPAPQGLEVPQSFGTSLGAPLHYPLQDEIALALPTNVTDPAPVQIFGVKQPAR
ncbi:MAG TPA: alpha-(1-_3)-arabinofuranosyltransferase family protein, partial [Acidimicrobiia bacterium]|nr:alpha-(1->3)-arabinofuranosyltransferase family protein [Acidimicrobiia bacterium]